MPAIDKPLDLNPTQAQAANASAPGLIAAASTTPVVTARGTAAAADSARSVWLPLAEAATEYATTYQPLNTAGQRRIGGIYELQSESVVSLVETDDANRQSLTLLPGIRA
jgi:hypothetical protein